MKTVALFGGAFDPPTLGHETIVKKVSQIVDQVWVVPCGDHPFGKKMAPFQDRVAMCQEVFLTPETNGKVSVITDTGSPSDLTFDVLNTLSFDVRHKDLSFYPVIGLDEAKIISHWYRWKELISQYRFIVVERGYDVHGTSQLELFYWRKYHIYFAPDSGIPGTSSTLARRNISYLNDKQLCKKWGSLDDMYEQELSLQVSRRIFDYAVKHRLYSECSDL